MVLVSFAVISFAQDAKVQLTSESEGMLLAMKDDSHSGTQTEALDFTGSDQGNVSKTIPANGTMKFTFNGTKGVNAIVNVTEKTNNLTVIFNENENQKADTTIDLNKDVSRKLTRTGKHTIEVINETAESVKFDLAVTIDSFSNSDSKDTGSSDKERIQLAKGASGVDLNIQLEGNATKKYVAFVTKGYMTCVMPETSLGAGVTIKINGKVHNPDNDGPCTAHSTKAKDQTIEFINNDNNVKNINVSISFNKHG